MIICRLLALYVGLLAVIVSPGLRLLARNVSRKCRLFVSPGTTVCRPLQLGNTEAMILNNYSHIIKRDVDARAETFLHSTFTPDRATSR